MNGQINRSCMHGSGWAGASVVPGDGCEGLRGWTREGCDLKKQHCCTPFWGTRHAHAALFQGIHNTARTISAMLYMFACRADG